MVKVRTRKAMTHPSFRMVVSRSLLVGQIKDDDLIREEDENIRKDESTFYLGHRLWRIYIDTAAHLTLPILLYLFIVIFYFIFWRLRKKEKNRKIFHIDNIDDVSSFFKRLCAVLCWLTYSSQKKKISVETRCVVDVFGEQVEHVTQSQRDPREHKVSWQDYLPLNKGAKRKKGFFFFGPPHLGFLLCYHSDKSAIRTFIIFTREKKEELNK